MKKFLFSILLGLSISSFESCTSCGNPLEKSATEFLNLIRNHKIWEAKQYCTQRAVNFIDSCMANEVRVHLNKVIDVKGTPRGNIGIISFCCVNGFEGNEFKMIKKDDKWWVDELGGILANN